MPDALTIIEVLAFLIEKGPGRTETELAEAIFGSAGYQQRVNQDCAMLERQGRVERRGAGGPSDPYRYYGSSGAAAFYAKDKEFGRF